MSPDFQKTFMEVAMAMSKKSKDGSTKVGAVLVKPNMRVASVGFNGFPKRIFDNWKYLNDPAYRKDKLLRMVHAEANALRTNDSGTTEGYHLVVTRHPCDKCALEIASYDVSHVWYHRDVDYETRWAESVADAKTIFDDAGIIVTMVPDE